MIFATNRVVASAAGQRRVFAGQGKYRLIVIKVIDRKRVNAVTRLTVGVSAALGGCPPSWVMDVGVTADALIGQRPIAYGGACSRREKRLLLLVTVSAHEGGVLS